MKRKTDADVNLMVVAVTIALAAGAAMFVVLAVIARPAHYSARLAAIGQQVDAADTLLRTGGDAGYPLKALCSGAPDVAAAALRQRLQGAASATGVALSSVEADPGAADEARGGLYPIVLKLEANGRYDGVVSMLGSLAKGQPELFVDVVDLKSLTSAVDLKLSGRIYCSTSDRL
ncbi:MAG: GspMb/PilO family protein [Caulobacteraceae bacterium]|nr:GspMb/PilO family protein [Caulobacteraceae bacterium]